MSPPAPQVADRPPPGGRSQIGTAAAPSARRIRLSFPGTKKPRDFPSGDQKSDVASSVPRTEPGLERREIADPDPAGSGRVRRCDPAPRRGDREGRRDEGYPRAVRRDGDRDRLVGREEGAAGGGGRGKRMVGAGAATGRSPRHNATGARPRAIAATAQGSQRPGRVATAAAPPTPTPFRNRRDPTAGARRRARSASARRGPWRGSRARSGRARPATSAGPTRPAAARPRGSRRSGPPGSRPRRPSGPWPSRRASRPSAKMSDRASEVFPSTCSGDM